MLLGNIRVCGCRVIITSWIAPLSTITLRLSLTPTRQFSTAIVILCEVNRNAHISRERPGNWRGQMELNHQLPVQSRMLYH